MAGRPPKFSNPEELEKKIEEYFLTLPEGVIPNKGNLAIYLDTTRETLSDYEDKEEYTDAIKRAYGLIEDAWVQRLKGQSVAGVIFYLKNAYSKEWRDKQETDITSGGEKIENITKIEYIVPKNDTQNPTGTETA